MSVRSVDRLTGCNRVDTVAKIFQIASAISEREIVRFPANSGRIKINKSAAFRKKGNAARVPVLIPFWRLNFGIDIQASGILIAVSRRCFLKAMSASVPPGLRNFSCPSKRAITQNQNRHFPRATTMKEKTGRLSVQRYVRTCAYYFFFSYRSYVHLRARFPQRFQTVSRILRMVYNALSPVITITKCIVRSRLLKKSSVTSTVN